jgi:hypothetical protein
MLFETIEHALYALVLFWLCALAVIDVKYRELPHWGSTFPMVAVGLLRVVFPPDDLVGMRAWLAGSAIFLLLAAVVLSDSAPLLGVFAATALGLGLQTGTVEVSVLVATWVLALLWAQWGFWGAGDAKVVMFLAAVWPDLYLVGALLMALVGGGCLALVRRYGRAAPTVFPQVLGELRQGNVPARQDAAQVAAWTHRAAVPWLTLGTALYVVGNVWLG